jgi:uncharacterized protein with GYD domain
MKYVLLGTLSPDSLTKQEKRTSNARAKLKELGIKLESVYYTQGHYDFVDVVDAPNAEALLAFSVWYGQQGFGRLQSLPAFDERSMVRSLKSGGMRGKKKK